MPYDPQRSRRRPQLADDGPAPIDALLDQADTDPEQVRAEPVAVPAARMPEAAFDEIEVASATERGRPRLVLLAAALLVVLLVFAWVRRRR
jgi:hypothetical protein